MYERKTYDEWEIWTNYGYGWECECTESTYEEARTNYRTYLENARDLIGIKLRKRRVRKVSE